MGGKKKTKWRKLPLEEFTKEIPTKLEKVPSSDTCQTDLIKEENSHAPSYNEPSEPAQNYTEPYEYIDGLWYPTSCVVYNPAEMGMYSNYVMPMNNCYYYYTMPEVPQMQEYVPMPYQEYTPALPKDTVYLLLPTQSLRPAQPVQNIAPEWQGRRRRRRYEGYADYAVIPDKQNSTKTDDKDSCKTTGRYVNSRKNSSQSNNHRNMTSFTETANFNDFNYVSEQYPSCSKSNDTKINSISHTNMNNLKGTMNANKEMDYSSNKDQINLKYKNNLDMCGIHSRNTTEKNEQTIKEKNNKSGLTSSKIEIDPENELHANDKANMEKSYSITNANSNSSLSDKQVENSTNATSVLNNKCTPQNQLKEQSDNRCNITLPVKENSEPFSSVQHSVCEQELNNKHEITPQKLNVTSNSNSASSLPDILSTLNKSLPNEKNKESDVLYDSPLQESEDHTKELYPKSKSLLSQTSYLPNFLSSEALHTEMEVELSQLQSLHSLQANQSIYKLAYDENITDQSEVDSRSPSPVDPESQVPSSLINDEILIHEADSGSDAGSEDVELLPHRYESESFLKDNKHVYVNKLSLAVELLRTQETLPYDGEFKRIIGENNQLNDIVPGVHTVGKTNKSFEENSNIFSVSKLSEIKNTSNEISTNNDSGYQPKFTANSSNDNTAFNDIEFESFEEDVYEPAKEVVPQNSEMQDNTEGYRAGYRRFGIQARNYFSPRAAFSLNPCLCCIIM